MAALCSIKLLVLLGVLFAFLFASPARAGESGHAPEESCPEGEEHDEQTEPRCCSLDMMRESSDGKQICQPAMQSVAVAITLILSFTFMISLQCMVHHHDVDMREYAYTVISSTVSIFSAVLMFQSCDGIVEDLICEPLTEATGLGTGMDLAIRLVQMLLWYAAMQLTIAVVSRALMSQAWRSQEILLAKLPRNQVSVEANESDHGHTNVMLNVEINSVCYGMVLAHLTGFASIKFWTGLQQTAAFHGSPLMTLVPLPVALLAQLIFSRLTCMCRESYIALNGEKDWFERTWDLKCQHAEDDITGLTLSVLIVNSVRYAINESYGHKCLPNSEQKEEGARCEFQHSGAEVGWLVGCGLLFVILLFSTKLLILKTSEEAGDIEAVESSRLRHLILGDAATPSSKSTSTSKLRDIEKEEKTSIDLERMEDIILTTLGMAYAWCLFHGTRQLLMTMNPAFLGRGQNATTLAVVLATGMTYIAFLIVRLLDKLADLPDEWTPPAIDDSIKTVIRGTSILIGFAWEQTFEESLDQLAERTRISYGPHAPAIAKLVIGSGCVSIVFLSWKWYILPFVFKKGWRYGYVFSRNDLHDRCQELATHDKQFALEHLHDVAQKLAKKSDEHRERFDLCVSKKLDGCYRSLPASEVEALREEIQALKIHTKYLEEQLEEERKAREESKIHCTFLERQLAEERRAHSDIKTCCKKCGQEFVSGPLVKEAKKREYLLEFLERHLEEERDAHARCSPLPQRGVGKEGAEGSVITSDSSLSLIGSPPYQTKIHHADERTCTPVMSSTPVNFRFPFNPSYSAQDKVTDQLVSSKANFLGPPVFTINSPAEAEEGKTKTYFERPPEIAGQRFGAENLVIPSTHVVEEGARDWRPESESSLPRRSAEFAKLGVADRRTAREGFDMRGQLGQRFSSQRFGSPLPSVGEVGATLHRSRSASSSSTIRRLSEPVIAERKAARELFEKAARIGQVFSGERFATPSPRNAEEDAEDQSTIPELNFSQTPSFSANGTTQEDFKHRYAQEFAVERSATPSPYVDAVGISMSESRSSRSTTSPEFANSGFSDNRADFEIGREFGAEQSATFSKQVEESAIAKLTASESRLPPSLAKVRSSPILQLFVETGRVEKPTTQEGAIHETTIPESILTPSPRKLSPSRYREKVGLARNRPKQEDAINRSIASESKSSPSPRKSSPSQISPSLAKSGLAEKRPTQEGAMSEIIASESKSSHSPRDSPPSQTSPSLAKSDLAEKRPTQEFAISEITISKSKVSPSPRDPSPSQISLLFTESDLAETRPTQEGAISEITVSESKSSRSPRDPSPSQQSLMFSESDIVEQPPTQKGAIDEITAYESKSSPSPRISPPSPRSPLLARSGLAEESPPHEHDKEGKLAHCNKIHQDLRKISDALAKLGATK